MKRGFLIMLLLLAACSTPQETNAPETIEPTPVPETVEPVAEPDEYEDLDTADDSFDAIDDALSAME